MANDTQEKKQVAPYISWKTFIAFIASIHGKVPAQVDASILRSMSGTARSQLISALKFLDLIDTDGITQDSLKKLADSYNSEQWKPDLAQFIGNSYRRVTGDLNMDTATPAMLRDRFRNNGGVDGGTVESAMRFYLTALKEAGVQFSDHLVVRQRAPKGGGTRRRTTTKPATDVQDEEPEIEVPDGTFEVSFDPLGLPGSAYLPEDISTDQWEAISGYVKMLLGFRLKAQGKQKSEEVA
jgi:hypothetical protein